MKQFLAPFVLLFVMGAVLPPGRTSADELGGSVGSAQPGLLSHTVPETSLACQDSLYLRLQKKSLGDMSAREYEYFVRKDKECDEERRLILSSAGGLTHSSVVGTPEPHGDQASHKDHIQAEDHGTNAGHPVLHTFLITVPMLIMMGAMAL